MKQILSQTINQNVKNNFQFGFKVEKTGLYTIEILANACAWWQNTLRKVSVYHDDNLAVVIDDVKFPKLNKDRGLYDGEAAWNGNDLKGDDKTTLIIVNLSKGPHFLKFLSERNPVLKTITIYEVGANFVQYIPKGNAQDGDRRQWITLIVSNLSVRHLTVTGSASTHPKGDEDDIKLVIDREIQQNPSPKAHVDWYWCGKILKGKSLTFDRDLILVPGLHYLEFWADRTPHVDRIDLMVEMATTRKRMPTVNNPKWTGDYGDDTEQLLLARAIWGEARGASKQAKIGVASSIRNRVNDTKHRWGLTYHDVILEKSQYSSFWEKPGKDPNLKALRDPLNVDVQKDTPEKWKEVYGIALGVISGEILDNADGSNHYYDISISAPGWADQKKFKKSIAPFKFYEL